MKFMAEKGIFTKGEIISIFVYPLFVIILSLIFMIISLIISSITKSDSFCIGNYCHEYSRVGYFSGSIFCAAFCIWLCVIEFKEKSTGRIIVSILLICIYLIIMYITFAFYELSYI